MSGEVPKAAVGIVNPAHYAVALKWSAGSSSAPICGAKGADEVAAVIRFAEAMRKRARASGLGRGPR